MLNGGSTDRSTITFLIKGPSEALFSYSPLYLYRVNQFLNTMKIKEELNKSDVEKGIKTYLDTAEFKAKIEKIVKDRLKDNKDLEDKVVEITKNVLVQLYKTLWTKRGFWTSNLSNKGA